MGHKAWAYCEVEFSVTYSANIRVPIEYDSENLNVEDLKKIAEQKALNLQPTLFCDDSQELNSQIKSFTFKQPDVYQIVGTYLDGTEDPDQDLYVAYSEDEYE